MTSALGWWSRPWGRAAAPSSGTRGTAPSQTPPEIALPESSAAVRSEEAPALLTMHGVLTAWRVADRALGQLAAGSPEWAAVNATIISLRASYLARFDEYLAASERAPGAGSRA